MEWIDSGWLWKAGLCGLPLFLAFCASQEISLRYEMPRSAGVYRFLGRMVFLVSLVLLLTGGLIAAMS